MNSPKRTKKLVSQDIRIVTAALNPKDTARVGDNSVAVACTDGTSEAGVASTAIAGVRGKATAGNYSVAICGDGGTAKSAANGYSISYDDGTAIAGEGDGGVAITRLRGKAVVNGMWGVALAQNAGQATLNGRWGVAIAMDGGSVSGKAGCLLVAKYLAGEEYRFAIGVVGQCGILADKLYVADGRGGLKQAGAK